MITSISITNFFSIGDTQTISFVKSGNTQEKGFYQVKKGTKVSLVNGFWGCNASGKTNILRAISTVISWMYSVHGNDLNSHFDIHPDLQINPNFKSKFGNQPTKLAIELLINMNKYGFEIHFVDNRIVFEELKTMNLEIKGSSMSLIYTRDNKNKIIFGASAGDVKDIFERLKLKTNQSILSAGVQLGLDFALAFRPMAYLWNTNSDKSMNLIDNLQTAINLKHNPEWIKDKAIEKLAIVLRTFDPTIESIEINLESISQINFKHTGFDQLVKIEDESRGTQELFGIFYQLSTVFKKGGVVVYDEINRFYHPDIQNSIIGMFSNKRLNKNNAQLIFSSHDYDIINELTKEQVNLVSKVDGETMTNQIGDFEDFRSDVNQTKKVRMGLYGSMPDIGEFEYNINEVL